MNVSVFGLGYVGVVSAACLARDGVQVVGVDVNSDKVTALRRGKPSFSEPGLEALLHRVTSNGHLDCTTSAAEAVAQTEISLISVGTPSDSSDALTLTHVFDVCREIARAVRQRAESHVVVLRSTVPPGATRACARILAEGSGGAVIDVAFNPEFLREGRALWDYDNPPYTVIGTVGERAEDAVKALYTRIDAPILTMLPEEAELLKMACNAWHATKVVFANEIGRLAKYLDVDGRVVMGALVRDGKLNVSSAYLRPGFAYGGSCLPKEVRALNALARERDVRTELLGSLAPSNAQHIEHCRRAVHSHGARYVGFLGIAFKAGTDDLRESAAMILARQLIEDGCEIRILDPLVRDATLVGANMQYVESTLPLLPSYMVESTSELLEFADLLIVLQDTEWVREALRGAGGKQVMDLVGLTSQDMTDGEYDGIAW